MQRVKVGVGLGIDPVRWDQHLTGLYRHDNVFGRLYGFTARAKAGYAELPGLYDPQQHGPVAGLDLELRKKGLLENKLVWTEAPGIELGLWDGYQFYAVKNRLGPGSRDRPRGRQRWPVGRLGADRGQCALPRVCRCDDVYGQRWECR